MKRLSSQPRTRVQPRIHILSPVSNCSPDLCEPRSLTKQPPFAHDPDARVQVVGNLLFVHHLDLGTLRRERWLRWPLGNNGFGLAAGRAFQFGDPQVEPVNFLDGNQVNFTKEFDDLRLVGVHAENYHV